VPATVAALILCHNRPDEVVDAVASLDAGFDEIIVLDNASEPPLVPIPGARLIRSDENTGVCGGRNRLLAECRSDLAVFLDDDAVALGPLSGLVRERFAADPTLAVIAFRITRPDGAVDLEHPFRGKADRVDLARPAAYFVGAGYAVRRAAVDSVGGYDESLFYSTEEIDLSMKLIRAGSTIWYEPSLAVEHRPSTRGRAIAPEVPAMRMRNRLLYARRHLKFPVAVVHGVIWAGHTFPTARRSGGLRRWGRAIRDGLRQPVDRRPLTWAQHRSTHQLGGRVWY